MDRFTIPAHLVSVIIPCYNEAATVGAVIDTAISHPLVREVIVVDDGSDDGTAAIAHSRGARVIRLSKNHGKATAMDIGVRHAASAYICFLDADVIGMTHQILTTLMLPVINGRAAMHVGLRDRKSIVLNRMLRVFPILGGERVLTKALWQRVPGRYKNKFQIEIALNYTAKQSGGRMSISHMPGVSQIIKEKKRGLWLGLFQRMGMIKDITMISARLYVLEPLYRSVRGTERMESSKFAKQFVQWK